MKINLIPLTAAEINHLLTLLADNEQEGWYTGNREQFENRAARITEKFKAALSKAEHPTQAGRK